MRVEVTVVDTRVGGARHALIDADDHASTGDVLTRLLTDLGASARSAEVVSLDQRRRSQERRDTALPVHHRGEVLDPTVPIAESGVRQGSLLVLGDAAASSLDEPDGVAELRVVGGPGAGGVHRIGIGDATIGSDPACTVVVDDDRVPPVAVVVTVGVRGDTTVRPTPDAGAVLTDTMPDVPAPLSLDREPLADDEATAWPTGAELTVGRTLVELARPDRPDAAVESGGEPGWLDYNRPPRLLPAERETTFRLPAPPKDANRNALPWIAMAMPAVMGVGLAVALDRWYMLTMAIFSPMMMLGSWLQTRGQNKKSHRQLVAEYREKKEATEQDAAQALVDERRARRLAAPDPASVLLIAHGPRARLWERRRTDPDYLSVRIGVGDLPSEVTVEDPEQLEHRRKVTRVATDVPVTVSLAERGVVGIAGRGAVPRQIAGWAVAQLAALQSPRDTWVYVLTDHDGAADWEWIRWLPHARPQSGQDTVVTIGTDTESCARRVAELSALLAARQSAAGVRGGAALDVPDVVIVLDGARRLRSLPGVVALLKQGPSVGIHTLALDADERLLPEEADAVVVSDGESATLSQQRVTLVDEIRPDIVGRAWLWRVSRALAPLRDTSGQGDDSVLPAACRLTEVLELEPPAADLVRARWSLQPRSTEAVVGVSLDGPFAIDLRRDGPHGLVAGTTGAGKSELLQTLVASLAVANRPDAMTFVLVDYKGGAAFKDCVDLPHTVGMVTDLDTHLVERALVSLGAELTRREHQLAEVGAKDIEDYVDLSAKRAGLEPMPRLLIVIDEFASLARELPDFVTGLVNIAQRGRSLGIHLILATQRPGGVVSPEIRANTNLRIALRVTDATESSDVIDAPDAARISKTTPGRAYVRLGASSLVPFQSGRVGGRRPGVLTNSAPEPWTVDLDLRRLAAPVPTRPRIESVDDAEVTDLTVLVAAIREANDTLGIGVQHSPWLPALGSDLVLADVESPEAAGTVPAVGFGIEDLPARQARRIAAIDFASFTHLAVVGGPRSGRSQLLRTVGAGLATHVDPSDVHVYALDCGNGALLPLADLPHCGAVVQRVQTDRVTRLFDRIGAELARRQEALATGGFADLEELRASTAPDERPPHILFVIDRWEGFLGSLSELENGRFTDLVHTLLREGASAGIHLLITGDRQLATTRMGTLIEDKIGLRMTDRTDYSLLGLQPRNLPEEIPEGRGYRADSGIELQIALIDADPAGQAQAAALRSLAETARDRWSSVPRSRLPFRVDVLPSRLGFEEAWQLVTADGGPADRWALAGVGGDELAALGFDLARTPAAMIGGPPRSGRSSALLVVAESLLRGGTEIAIVAPRPSPLRDLTDRAGVRGVLTHSEVTEEELVELLGDGPVVLLVDDAELVKDCPAKDWLRQSVRRLADEQRAIVLAGDPADMASGFSGWQVDLKGRQGILITPQSGTDGELVGVRIPRSSVGQTAPPGRVLAHTGDGTLRTLQVPLPPT